MSECGAQLDKCVSVTQEEREWASALSVYKYAVDLQSKEVDARRAGAADRNIEIALNMIADGEPVEKIIRYTDLTHDELENLGV